MASYHKEFKSRVILGEYRTPKLVAWLLKHSGGLLKTQRQAAYVLLGFILFTLIAVPYFFFHISQIVQHPLIYTPASGTESGRGVGANTYYP